MLLQYQVRSLIISELGRAILHPNLLSIGQAPQCDQRQYNLNSYYSCNSSSSSCYRDFNHKVWLYSLATVAVLDNHSYSDRVPYLMGYKYNYSAMGFQPYSCWCRPGDHFVFAEFMCASTGRPKRHKPCLRDVRLYPYCGNVRWSASGRYDIQQ